jgi:hypothetical protein
MVRVILAFAAFIAGIAPMAARPVSPETAVFAALFDGLGPLPDTLLFGDSTLRFHLPSDASRSWRAQFDSIPQLPTRLEEISKTRVATASLAFPRPMRVLAGAELREIFSAGPSGWAEFYRRYPNQRSYLDVSPVAFSADSLDALVYYEHHCGGLCGSGEAVWLSRPAATDRWRIRKKVMFWVS